MTKNPIKETIKNEKAIRMKRDHTFMKSMPGRCYLPITINFKKDDIVSDPSLIEDIIKDKSLFAYEE